MTTTIQVSDNTKQLLERMKKEQKERSYDAVIQHLVRKDLKVAESMFGAVKGTVWKKSDRLKFHD